MKTLTLFFLAAIAAFSQEATPSKGYYAGGLSGAGPFAVVGLRLNDSTSTYTNANVAGTFTVSQGIVRRVMQINNFKVSLLGEAGAAITGDTGFAGAVGGVLSYDISKWTHMQGTSVMGVVKMQKTGDITAPVYGLGFVKSF